MCIYVYIYVCICIGIYQYNRALIGYVLQTNCRVLVITDAVVNILLYYMHRYIHIHIYIYIYSIYTDLYQIYRYRYRYILMGTTAEC